MFKNSKVKINISLRSGNRVQNKCNWFRITFSYFVKDLKPKMKMIFIYFNRIDFLFMIC